MSHNGHQKPKKSWPVYVAVIVVTLVVAGSLRLLLPEETYSIVLGSVVLGLVALGLLLWRRSKHRL